MTAKQAFTRTYRFPEIRYVWWPVLAAVDVIHPGRRSPFDQIHRLPLPPSEAFTDDPNDIEIWADGVEGKVLRAVIAHYTEWRSTGTRAWEKN